MPRALFVYGGWNGHTPKESAELFARELTDAGFEVALRDTLEPLADVEALKGYDLVVPTWTMGQITDAQERGLCDAVSAGVGIAGWHGTMCDSFRSATRYQFMTGGQFVAHPGDIQPRYDVRIVDRDHPITRGLADFALPNSEQYYMHVDPSNHVLATTTFKEGGVVMPVAWTRLWGKGRVAYASFGHTYRDFDVPEAREMVKRALQWASR